MYGRCYAKCGRENTTVAEVIVTICMSQLHYERGWTTRNSLITVPLASVGSNEGRQSLPAGTQALLAGPTGFMVTQTTEVSKNKRLDAN